MLLLLWIQAQAAVMINEALIDAPGSDTDQHWVELYNTGPTPVDLTGWTLERAKSAWDLDVPLSGVIPARGWFVVGEVAAPAADLVVPLLDLGNASGSADAIRLLSPRGVIVDTLVYGAPNTDGWDDDARLATPLTAPSPISGLGLARAVDGDDSDDASLDFVNQVATPGGPNGGPAPATCDAGQVTLLINELFPNPTGVDDGWEWVELHNHGPRSLDLSGWVIEAGTSGFSTSGALPAGTRLAAGGLLVVGQSAAVAGVDVVVPGFSLGNGTVDADAARIVDCLGGVRDTVVYGPGNLDGWLSDDGLPAVPALAPPSGSSLARVTDGTDANLDSEDFGVYRARTPGALNPLLLSVTPAPLTPGAWMTLSVRGALPGATVHFGAQGGPGQPACPPGLGGLCLAISQPLLLGSARSGIDRVARMNVTLPLRVAPGTEVWLQAAVVGAEADVSTVWYDIVQP